MSERNEEKAKRICVLMRCIRFCGCHDFYLTPDVCLWTYIFGAFRGVFLKEYHLDPVHFFSAINLRWERMLNTTKFEITLLVDTDSLLFSDRVIRGGINGNGPLSLFKGNNRYMEDFDKSQSSVFGVFFDFISLYAGTRKQPLHCANYKWWNDLIIDNFLNADCLGGAGYFIEVRLEHVPPLHDHTNDLLLAPEKLQIENKWLWDYAKSFGSAASQVAKLVENVFHKFLYVRPFRNLKFYVEKGLTVKRFFCVLQFDQSCWLG